jgi:hypothetical protein
MDPRTRRVFALAIVAILVLTGGAALVLGGPGPDEPPGAESVVGVIVEVQATSLSDVCCFKLRTTDGDVLDFELAPGAMGPLFPPGHLVEHQATAQPVRVWYRGGVDSWLAYRVEDAP